MNIILYLVELAVISAMLGVAIVLLAVNGGKHGKNKYDERQKIAQGKAYTAAYWTLFAWIVIDSFVQANVYQWCKPMVGAAVGIVVSLTVFSVYCIATDAYFSAKDNIRISVISTALIGVSNLLLGIMELISGRIFVDGQLAPNSINLLFGVMFAIIFAALLIKHAVSKHSEEE